MSLYETLIDTELAIHEAYYEGAISEDEYDSLLYEYTAKETAKIAGRKVKNTVGNFLNDCKEEFQKAIEDMKKKGIAGKASSIQRIVGIGGAFSVQLSSFVLVGPIDWAITAASVAVSLPAEKYNIPILEPLYKTTTKPFLDEIRNRYNNKVESLKGTINSIKKSKEDLKSKIDTMDDATRSKKVNALMSNIFSLAKSIDKLQLSIQRDINKKVAKAKDLEDRTSDPIPSESYFQFQKDKIRKQKTKAQKLRTQAESLKQTQDDVDKLKDKVKRDLKQ